MKITMEEWNLRYPIGTPVRYHPIIGDPEYMESKTRSVAWNLGHGAPVVKIEGITGGVLLEAIDVVSPQNSGASA